MTAPSHPPDDLIKAATAARQNAYAPYSNFKVGAALRTKDGQIFQGCNVENVAYPEGTCAEAGAIAAMIAGGATQCQEVLVIADAPTPVTPCGGCRQKLREFCESTVVVHMLTTQGAHQSLSMDALLPGAFDAAQMSLETES